MSLLPGACGTILGEDVKHCLSCGAELPPPSETCPACRAPQPAALYVPVPATSVFDPPVVAPTAGLIPSQPAASSMPAGALRPTAPVTPGRDAPALPALDTPAPDRKTRTRKTATLVSVLVLLLVLGLAAYAVGQGKARGGAGTVESAADMVTAGTGDAGTQFLPAPA